VSSAKFAFWNDDLGGTHPGFVEFSLCCIDVPGILVKQGREEILLTLREKIQIGQM